MDIPKDYPKSYRQIPPGTVFLIERVSNDKKWVDLLAKMPDGRRVYVTTKFNSSHKTPLEKAQIAAYFVLCPIMGYVFGIELGLLVTKVLF